MSDKNPQRRPPLTLILLGSVMAIFGLTLLTLGIKLVILDGSLYYAIAGLTLLVTGALLIIQRSVAIGIYAAFLLGSTVWSLA